MLVSLPLGSLIVRNMGRRIEGEASEKAKLM